MHRSAYSSRLFKRFCACMRKLTMQQTASEEIPETGAAASAPARSLRASTKPCYVHRLTVRHDEQEH